jgi:hypothetical protein
MTPFPKSCRIHVYRDDGQWSDDLRWFERSDEDIAALYVTTITLPVGEDDYPDLTLREWDAIVAKWCPDHILVYTS